MKTRKQIQKDYRLKHVEQIKEYNRRPEVKKRRSIRNIKWQKDNPDKVKIIRKIFRQKHRERLNKEYKEWYKNNSNKAQYCAKRWKKNHPEKAKEYSLNQRIKNPKKIAQSVIKWKKKHPENLRILSKRRRAKKKGAEGFHTEQEWKQKKKEYNYRCAYCGVHESIFKNKYKDKRWWKLTEDHVIALTKGGSDYIQNIVPSCITCNLYKYNKML